MTREQKKAIYSARLAKLNAREKYEISRSKEKVTEET